MIHDHIIVNDEGYLVPKRKLWFTKAIQKARQEIMAQEDAEIFRILDSLAQSGNNVE